jgi:flagellar motility protein MotE (MotC chaperone)
VKQIRLLPVVIFAALALLLFKGIGLVTEGGYVLTGPRQVLAAGGGSSGEAKLTVPTEPTLADTSPTLADNPVTLPLADAAAAAGGHDPAPAEPAPTPAPAQPAVPVAEAPLGVCPPDPGDAKPEEGATPSPVDPNNCVPIPINAAGDAIPLIRDADGHMVPLDSTGGSTDTLNQRLAERREELDVRAAELDMRLALVEAAEKRIAERTAVLEGLEARINALVEEKRTLEEAQFAGVVAMYETMKPKDAAAIFDQLEMSVLLRVAKAVNPRKMAPIMAKMDPMKAKDLTAGLAVDRVEPTVQLTSDNLSALPQIVGQ